MIGFLAHHTRVKPIADPLNLSVMVDETDADVLVVGMGPAGSSCAWLLATLGLRVVGIDRKRFPRRKPCGGCITDRVKKLLGGVTEGAIEREYYGARLVHSSGEDLHFRSGHPIAYGVSREAFDHLLLGKALEAGVCVKQAEKFLRANKRNSYVEAVTDRGTYRVLYLVGADGVNGILSRWVRGVQNVMVAYEVRVPGWPFDDPSDTVRIYFGSVSGGYGWAFPKEGYTAAGIVTRWPKKKSPRALLRRFLRDALDIDETGSLDLTGGTIPLYRSRDRVQLASDRVLLVGDSGGFADPFLAEGLSYAVQSSFIAAPIIAGAAARGDGDLNLYEEAVHELVHSSFDYSSTFSNLIYRFPGLAYRLIRRKRGNIEELFELIRGNKNYRELIGGLGTILRVLG